EFRSPFRGSMPDVMGAIGNGAGLPAIIVPNGVGERGLPTSLQFMGRAWEENAILAAARAYQSLTDWHLRHPAGYRRSSLLAGREDGGGRERGRVAARPAAGVHRAEEVEEDPVEGVGVLQVDRVAGLGHHHQPGRRDLALHEDGGLEAGLVLVAGHHE